MRVSQNEVTIVNIMRFLNILRENQLLNAWAATFTPDMGLHTVIDQLNTGAANALHTIADHMAFDEGTQYRITEVVHRLIDHTASNDAALMHAIIDRLYTATA